jgi:hypothetical protein
MGRGANEDGRMDLLRTVQGLRMDFVGFRFPELAFFLFFKVAQAISFLLTLLFLVMPQKSQKLSLGSSSRFLGVLCENNPSNPIDVNSLKSIGCTFIIFSTIPGSNFLLFIFVPAFYRVTIISFDHGNGSTLSLRGLAFTLPFLPGHRLLGSSLPAAARHKPLFSVLDSSEICCCQEIQVMSLTYTLVYFVYSLFK